MSAGLGAAAAIAEKSSNFQYVPDGPIHDPQALFHGVIGVKSNDHERDGKGLQARVIIL